MLHDQIEVDQALFVITAAEISIALGESPVEVVIRQLFAWWCEDQCVSLSRITRLAARVGT
jgi:hypothetical protein